MPATNQMTRTATVVTSEEMTNEEEKSMHFMMCLTQYHTYYLSNKNIKSKITEEIGRIL